MDVLTFQQQGGATCQQHGGAAQWGDHPLNPKS